MAPVTPRTDAYLAHSPIPVQFTDEDLDQVLAGNFVTKVIYLPDPEFQELALAGVETLVSTRLDPGVDPIAEADRRGSILAILRIGNLDLQMPGQMMAMNGGIEQAQYYEGRKSMEGGEYGGEYGGDYGGGEYCPPRLRRRLAAAARWARKGCRHPVSLRRSRRRASCRASTVRSGACRSPARRSVCPVRRTFRWVTRPACVKHEMKNQHAGA